MDVDELYGLALDRFVAERGALAKALRAEKRRDEAAAVAALRKPSVAAWAVNQLVRTQAAAVEELYEAGDALRRAQADLLAGEGDGRTLRAAGGRERAAVDELVEAARGLLSSEGHELSDAMVDRVSDTLHAAALDEEAREEVRDGRLERELRHVGLGLGLGESVFAAPAPAPAASKRAATSKAASKEARERAEAERAEAERAAREREAARDAARAAETSARRRAERAARALKAAEERRERAAQALDEADAALADAREEAQEATDAHEQAKEHAERH